MSPISMVVFERGRGPLSVVWNDFRFMRSRTGEDYTRLRGLELKIAEVKAWRFGAGFSLLAINLYHAVHNRGRCAVQGRTLFVTKLCDAGHRLPRIRMPKIRWECCPQTAPHNSGRPIENEFTIIRPREASAARDPPGRRRHFPRVQR